MSIVMFQEKDMVCRISQTYLTKELVFFFHLSCSYFSIISLNSLSSRFWGNSPRFWYAFWLYSRRSCRFWGQAWPYRAVVLPWALWHMMGVGWPSLSHTSFVGLLKKLLSLDSWLLNDEALHLICTVKRTVIQFSSEGVQPWSYC